MRRAIAALAALIVGLSAGTSGLAAAGKAKEFRGAWVSTVFNIDWPSKPGLSSAAQKAELLAIFDRAKELQLTAILLQVRPASDALYASKIEPWSAFLTGTQGTAAAYDPLAFAVQEAHARGIELHAWINPFRASTTTTGPFALNHITQTHPDWIRKEGKLLWTDPGVPAAREHVLRVVLDIVHRYAVDGVHIDDYFYPYPTKGGKDFDDERSWTHYGVPSGMSRADWRRDNINQFIEQLYTRVKAERSSVKVGISPFGIYRPHVPATIEAGVDAYASLYCDAKLWLARGWCDYLAPQLYWPIDPPAQSFPVLLNWWREQSTMGRPIWPGLASTRIGEKRPAKEIADQIALTRKGTTSPGHIHWNMKSLMQNRGGIADLLKANVYGTGTASNVPVRQTGVTQ
jgi:uncharacterized lipoprotein YddW (UPF0748 family)